MSFNIKALIYDRTALDVAEKTDKGYYNATDLNRVQTAMKYIAERFNEYGYEITLNNSPVWSISDIPNQGQLSVYLSNLSKLRNVLNVLVTTPAVPPDMEGITWQEANDIEKILADIDWILNQMEKSFLRCGHVGVYCGARGLPTEGFVSIYPLTWAELDALNLTWDDWNQSTWFTLIYRGR